MLPSQIAGPNVPAEIADRGNLIAAIVAKQAR